MTDHLINWTGALFIAFGMALVQSDVPDHSAERTQAIAQEAANRAEDEVAASKRADYEICKQDHGENVGVEYRPDGSHRCTLKNGRAIRNQIVIAEKR